MHIMLLEFFFVFAGSILLPVSPVTLQCKTHLHAKQFLSLLIRIWHKCMHLRVCETEWHKKNTLHIENSYLPKHKIKLLWLEHTHSSLCLK